jgi:hypothetical protein
MHYNSNLGLSLTVSILMIGVSLFFLLAAYSNIIRLQLLYYYAYALAEYYQKSRRVFLMLGGVQLAGGLVLSLWVYFLLVTESIDHLDEDPLRVPTKASGVTNGLLFLVNLFLLSFLTNLISLVCGFLFAGSVFEFVIF